MPGAGATAMHLPERFGGQHLPRIEAIDLVPKGRRADASSRRGWPRR